MTTTVSNPKTMPSKPNSKVDFRDLELKNKINERYPNRSEGLTSKRDLKRYYKFIEETLKELNLSNQEAGLIVEAFKDQEFDYEKEELLPIQREIVGAIALEQIKTNHLPDVRKNEFIEKISEWQNYHIFAITDAVERYWNLEKNCGESRYSALNKTGLARY